MSSRLFITLALLAPLLCVAPTAKAQPATVVSEPEGGTLLYYVGQWSSDSEIGDLRQVQFEADDVELRYWIGFGLLGTRAVVLRRRSGLWEAYAVEYESCSVPAPRAILHDDSAVAVFEDGLSMSDCPKNRTLGLMATAENLHISEIPVGTGAEGLWGRVLSAGAFELAPEPRPGRAGYDGTTIVFEIRIGPKYRATRMRVWPDRQELDNQLGAIARLLADGLGIAAW